jgi:hypothetical protein
LIIKEREGYSRSMSAAALDAYLGQHRARELESLRTIDLLEGRSQDLPPDLPTTLEGVREGIEHDLAALADVTARLGVSVDEGVEVSGDGTGSSGAALLLSALEALVLAAHAKALMWQSLQTLADPRLEDLDFTVLLQRAHGQADIIELQRRDAVRAALGRDEGTA